VIIVSDTSPLNYLVLIGEIDVLPKLFSEVLVPPSVLAELNHAHTPEIVKQWATPPPSWLKVREPSFQSVAVARLGRGEADAINLAQELGIFEILIDERKGWRVADACGLRPISTLAVLEIAASQGLLDLSMAIKKILKTTFYITEEHISAALERDAARKRAGENQP
jgi:predicted nucleic acid-binding protein